MRRILGVAARVLRDLRVGALGQDLAAREHRDRLREVGDDGEVVLDHEDGAILGGGVD